MFNFDDTDLKQYRKNLEDLRKGAFALAVRSTLDRMAYLTKNEYKKEVKKSFVIRKSESNIILKSIGYTPCGGGKNPEISKLEAQTGQKAVTFGKQTDQLKKQEFGDPIIAKGKHLFKPWKSAREGSWKNAVSPNHFLSNIDAKMTSELVKHPAKTIEDRFNQAVGYAKHNPDKPFYWLADEPERRGQTRGIAWIDGKQEFPIADYLYSVSSKTQTLTSVPALERATQRVLNQKQEIFINEVGRRIEKELSKKLTKG